jgi:hypothetical protein
MHSNRLKSMKGPVASWLRVLSDRCHVMFNSFPRLGDAVGADDLPVFFILKRDSRREKAGNGKHHHPMPAPVVKGIDRASDVHVAEHRAHARSTLRANADRRNKHRAA